LTRLEAVFQVRMDQLDEGSVASGAFGQEGGQVRPLATGPGGEVGGHALFQSIWIASGGVYHGKFSDTPRPNGPLAKLLLRFRLTGGLTADNQTGEKTVQRLAAKIKQLPEQNRRDIPLPRRLS